MSDWKESAIKLANTTDLSWRAIARDLGVAKSSVSDLLRKHFHGYVNPSDKVSIDKTKLKKNTEYLSLPKILVLDIETSSLMLQAFSIWNVNAGLGQIHEDWNILSYAAKWYGAPPESVVYRDVSQNESLRDDSNILEELWHLLDEADFVVCHNAKFDTKKINSRLILNGFSKPSPYRVIDTLKIAKSQFGFTSNKLEYLTDKLCVEYKKLKHGKFAGFELWKQCLLGNEEAWEEMELYNKYDILSLEELLTILAPWDNKLPNLDLYTKEVLDNSEWEHVGYAYTNLSKFDKYRNKTTGQYKRGRANLLTKEKRESLLSNII